MTAKKNDAAKAEALDEPTPVDYDGVTYFVPPALDLPIELLEADGELDVVRLILGEDQYKAFRSKPRTLRHLKDFGEKLADAAGFGDLGN